MTAGDGTNDVLVSIRVDTGTVTGVGIDTVTDVVDAASTKSWPSDALVVTCTSCVIPCNTYENSPRVPPHNVTGTLSVVGTRTLAPGRKPNLTPGVVVTSSLSPRAAINVPRSNSPKTHDVSKDRKRKTKKAEIVENIALDTAPVDKNELENKEEIKTIKITKTEGTTRGYREVVAKKVSEVSE